MADFLENLVARSTGKGKVIQPRPVSRFEPAPVPGLSGLGDWAEPEAPEGDRTDPTVPYGAAAPDPVSKRPGR